MCSISDKLPEHVIAIRITTGVTQNVLYYTKCVTQKKGITTKRGDWWQNVVKACQSQKHVSGIVSASMRGRSMRIFRLSDATQLKRESSLSLALCFSRFMARKSCHRLCHTRTPADRNFPWKYLLPNWLFDNRGDSYFGRDRGDTRLCIETNRSRLVIGEIEFRRSPIYEILYFQRKSSILGKSFEKRLPLYNARFGKKIGDRLKMRIVLIYRKLQRILHAKILETHE